MEVVVAVAGGRQRIDVRGADLRPVAAEVCEPQIVEQHDDDVGSRRVSRSGVDGFAVPMRQAEMASWAE